MGIDSDIFGAPSSTVKADSDIFKDIPQSEPEAVKAAPEASSLNILQRRMGLGHKGNTGPLDALHAINNAITEFGGGVTDLASRAGAPPSIAAPLGVAANLGLQGLTMLGGGPESKALTTTEQAANALAAQRAATLAGGRELGMTVPPTTVNPSFVNRTIESVGGKAATAQEAAAKNEAVSYAVAQREAGLKPNQSINKENLDAARERLAQPYRDVAALENIGPLGQPPFSSPAKTLEDLKDSRNNAKELWAYYNTSKKPQALRDAQAASAKSDQLEQFLEAQAGAAGKPELVQALREARVALAKNYTVERAMRGSSFDPSALSRLESRGRAPLGGDLETVMQMYRDFPKAMAAPQVGGSIGVSQLFPVAGGAAGGTIGALLGGGAGAGIGSVAGVVAGQTIPPAARALLLSKQYQNAMGQIPTLSPSSGLAPMLLGPAAVQLGALYQH